MVHHSELWRNDYDGSRIHKACSSYICVERVLKMENTKCPHIVDNSKSRTTVPHYYCTKTGKVAVTILHQTLYCEECPYRKNKNYDKALEQVTIPEELEAYKKRQ